MAMYTKFKNLILIALLLILGATIHKSVLAAKPFELAITNDKDTEARLRFMDKLYACENYKYHAEPSGIYEINGKINNACNVKWTIATCDFPEGVYQEIAKVQKHRITERVQRHKNGIVAELNDKEYRYLLEVGNKYCIVQY